MALPTIQFQNIDKAWKARDAMFEGPDMDHVKIVHCFGDCSSAAEAVSAAESRFRCTQNKVPGGAISYMLGAPTVSEKVFTFRNGIGGAVNTGDAIRTPVQEPPVWGEYIVCRTRETVISGNDRPFVSGYWDAGRAPGSGFQFYSTAGARLIGYESPSAALPATILSLPAASVDKLRIYYVQYTLSEVRIRNMAADGTTNIVAIATGGRAYGGRDHSFGAPYWTYLTRSFEARSHYVYHAAHDGTSTQADVVSLIREDLEATGLQELTA